MFEPFMEKIIPNEMKTRMVAMQNRIEKLAMEQRKNTENFKKVNQLLKECIRRI